MTKHFCDGCGEELDTGNSPNKGTTDDRLAIEVLAANRSCKLNVEVLIGKDGTSNSGEFCVNCILDALYALDKRPKQASQ